MAAFNSNGEVYSESAGFTIGEKPDAPINAPQSVTSLTSSKRLTIQVETVTVDASTPAILSYSIEVDDGQGGDFFSIFGELSDTLSTVAN